MSLVDPQTLFQKLENLYSARRQLLIDCYLLINLSSKERAMKKQHLLKGLEQNDADIALTEAIVLHQLETVYRQKHI